MDCTKGGLDLSTQANRLVPIAQDQTFTLLSHAKYRDSLKLLNFKPSWIKVTGKAIK